MTPSPFLIQLAVLLLPGVIWAHMDTKFAAKRKPSEIVFVVRALLFGLAAYSLTYAAFFVLAWPFEMINLNEVEDTNVITEAVVRQIAAASLVGFVLSIIWMYGVNFKVLTRFLQWIRATNRYGDEDIWDYTFNSRDAASEYVFVRNFETKVAYSGWVLLFSETEKLRELLLRDVEVFNFEGELLYETPRVYLASKTEGVHIEFPYKAKTEPSR